MNIGKDNFTNFIKNNFEKKDWITLYLHSEFGSVVQLVRMLPCHGRGRGFESRPVRENPLIFKGLFYWGKTKLLL